MIGVDFGGTSVKLAIVEGAKVLHSTSIDTPVGEAPGVVLDAIAEAVLDLGAAPKQLGMAVPGEVDSTGKCWRLPNVPGFEGVEIAAELRRRTGARVIVENDGTAAAYGEYLFGHGPAHASFLVVCLGTGIGGGLVINRRLVRGKNGFAAEIGHVTIVASAEARPCGCGNRGCLEAYAGTRALLDYFRDEGGVGDAVLDIADAARRGERPGLIAFERMSQALGVAINSIQNVLDLDAIVFTGGISRSFDLIEPHLRATMRFRSFAKPLGEVPLLVSQLSDLAGVIGAAHLPDLE